ncbi:hypothetical protein [Geminocystis herdmanii]|uniref:hypothetical protein n=1 Tax=Geminocystis herdmanii TaxID=669359 RepID=UPI0003494D6A|nr:hypothetical protein [Geminocystis herdmanii]
MKKIKFVLCINNKNEDDLTIFKVYQVLVDNSANKDNYLRIIDDSQEDYLYPASYFIMIDLPENAQKLFAEIN